MACKVEMIWITLVKAHKNTVNLLYRHCDYLFIHAVSGEMPQSNKSMLRQSSFKCPLCLLSGAISKHFAVVNPWPLKAPDGPSLMCGEKAHECRRRGLQKQQVCAIWASEAFQGMEHSNTWNTRQHLSECHHGLTANSSPCFL